MTEEQFNQTQATGDATFLDKPQPQPTPAPGIPPFSLDEYQPYLEALRRFKKPLTVAPTFIPRTLFEQIQFYDDETHKRVYFYFNGWSYITLT